MEPRLSFQQQKAILKWYWRIENVEIQWQWRHEYKTEPPTRLTTARNCDIFETHGTVCDVHKGRYGRPPISTSPESSAMVLKHFEHSLQKSTKKCACETGISRTSVCHINKTAELKVFIPGLLHALNEDDPDRRMKYCEWFWNMVQENKAFVEKVVWSDEAQFKLNGTFNRHNCVYWRANNPHVSVENTVNSPGELPMTKAVLISTVRSYGWSF